MSFSFKKIAKHFFFFAILPLFFTSCIHKYPIDGSNNFHSLVSSTIDKSINKMQNYIGPGEIILVSDFVNINNLKNRSELGFLLSNMLKDKLSSKDIVIKEIELGKEFEYGQGGFNLLTRKQEDILHKSINNKYAVVGTYSITSKTLNIFIRLIDVNSGNILSSSYGRTAIDDEILGLEGLLKEAPLPPVRPHLVL